MIRHSEHSPATIIGFMAMIVGMFMAILDIQIVASSLSEIGAGLSASNEEISWVQTSYLIAEAIMVPLSGFLARMMSTRLLFCLSATGFTLASIGCAFASTLPEMIFWRVLQGFLGGAMIPTAMATSFRLFPGKARQNVVVLIGLIITLAPTIGPTLGGWLTENLSWRWLFLVNIVPGILCVTLVWRSIRIDTPQWNLMAQFDWWGLIFLTLFLGALEYVIDEGSKVDWWQDHTIRFWSAVVVFGGIGLFWRLLTAAQPIIDLRVFKNRNFTLGTMFGFVVGAGLFGAVFLIPQFLGRVRGWNAEQIGHMMAITGITQIFAAPLTGKIAGKFGERFCLTMGFVLFAVALFMTSRLTSQSGYADMTLAMMVRGFALMFTMLSITTVALGTLPPNQVNTGSGLFTLLRNIGGAVGLALINTQLTDRAAHHARVLKDSLTITSPQVQEMIEQMTLPSGNAQIALARISRMIQIQAQTLSFNDVILMLGTCFAIMLPLILLLQKPKKLAPDAAAH